MSTQFEYTTETRETLGQIYGLIPKVMADIGSVGKDRKNEQQKYAFRGIEDMYLAAHPAMVKHGIFCAPEVLERQEYRFEKTNDQGRVTTWLHVALKVAHRFYAGDGSYITVTTCGEGLDNSDKATNKAMSGAMKYALIELFCVPTADVEDSDRSSPENGTTRKPQSVTVQPVTFTRKSESAAANLGSGENNAPSVKGESEAPPAAEDLLVECITSGQVANLSRTFRDALHQDYKKQADEILHEFLRKEKILDVLGKPSKLAIRKDSFLEVRDSAEEFARGYSK